MTIRRCSWCFRPSEEPEGEERCYRCGHVHRDERRSPFVDPRRIGPGDRTQLVVWTRGRRLDLDTVTVAAAIEVYMVRFGRAWGAIPSELLLAWYRAAHEIVGGGDEGPEAALPLAEAEWVRQWEDLRAEWVRQWWRPGDVRKRGGVARVELFGEAQPAERPNSTPGHELPDMKEKT